MATTVRREGISPRYLPIFWKRREHTCLARWSRAGWSRWSPCGRRETQRDGPRRIFQGWRVEADPENAHGIRGDNDFPHGEKAVALLRLVPKPLGRILEHLHWRVVSYDAPFRVLEGPAGRGLIETRRAFGLPVRGRSEMRLTEAVERRIRY